MIRARLEDPDGNEKDIMLLALTPNDMMELLDGKIIDFDASEMDLPEQRVIVISGVDETQVLHKLSADFGVTPREQ